MFSSTGIDLHIGLSGTSKSLLSRYARCFRQFREGADCQHASGSENRNPSGFDVCRIEPVNVDSHELHLGRAAVNRRELIVMIGQNDERPFRARCGPLRLSAA